MVTFKSSQWRRSLGKDGGGRRRVRRDPGKLSYLSSKEINLSPEIRDL